jgi:hypothetical protein
MSKPAIEIWAVTRPIPYEINSKKHPPQQIAKIAGSIREFGWTQPIVVDRHGVIIAGHGRRLAAIELGLREVPVWVRDDLDDNQVKALRLVDNKSAESEIDTELFRQELAQLDFDLSEWFDPKELEYSLADLGEINTDAFVDDVAGAVDAQEEETRSKAAAAVDKPVALWKVLGFKEIQGRHQLTISRFMAEIEHRTGRKGEDALVEFAAGILETA